jgi:hypothetical protein
MFGDDLVSITRRSRKDIEHDVLDGVCQLAKFFGRTAFLDVNANKRHTPS